MSAETLLVSRKASQVFFFLVSKGQPAEKIASACGMRKAETKKLLEQMIAAGMIARRGKRFAVDWDGFLPVFLHQAMNIYAAAMPWKYIPRYMESGEKDFIEAACARAGREIARVKVKLASNDLFCKIIQAYFVILATETIAPDDYLEDLRILDAIAEFEYALLKMFPRIGRTKPSQTVNRELHKTLRDWYKQIQGYDTPTGAALRAAFGEFGLLKTLQAGSRLGS